MTETPLPEHFAKLRCLHTGSSLLPAQKQLVERLNAGITSGSIRDNLGRPVRQLLVRGLTNAEVSVCYPIVDGVIQLLLDEAIPLQQLEIPDE